MAKDSVASVREITYEIVKEILKYEELDNNNTFMWDDEVYICKIYTDTVYILLLIIIISYIERFIIQSSNIGNTKCNRKRLCQ